MRHKECTTCGMTMIEEEISMLPHDCEWQVTTPASCYAKGIKEFVCKDCFTVTRTESIPMTSHVYDITENEPPKADEDGHITYKCRNCGNTYTDTIPKTGP